jgi:hypothetical protein
MVKLSSKVALIVYSFAFPGGIDVSNNRHVGFGCEISTPGASSYFCLNTD